MDLYMNLNKEMQTLVDLVHHIVKTHHELRPVIEKIIFQEQGKNATDVNFLLALNNSLLSDSKSQLRQDLFVLSELGYKNNGFFVEFGATNGIDLSNTYLLEKKYGWTGILAEPAKVWHTDLQKNRNAKIDMRCVWKVTGESLLFNETNYAELSTIATLSSADHHAKSRENGKSYDVQTVTLMDLLEEHNAPTQIDYLSIDTEGSEFDILEKFDFQKYQIKLITCEHNFSPMRFKLDALFKKNGYIKKYEQLSQFDDWWVRK